MKTRNLLLYICIIAILSFPCLGQTVTGNDYWRYGADESNANTGYYDADYNNYGYDSISFSVDDRGSSLGIYSPLVSGNIDDDPNVEIINAGYSGIFIYEYDIASQQFLLEYSDISHSAMTPLVIYDTVEDGVSEMYYCGIDKSVGNSTFYRLSILNNSINIDWERQVANGVIDPNVLSWAGCSGSSANSTVSMPICTEVGGTPYCLLAGGADTAVAPSRSSDYFTIYRFNAISGSESKYNPYSDTFSESINLGLTNEALYQFGLIGSKLNGDQGLIVQPTISDVNLDGNKEFAIPVTFLRQVGPVYGNGILVMDITTMGSEDSFYSDGLLQVHSDVNLGISTMFSISDALIFADETSTESWKIRRQFDNLFSYLEKSLGSDVVITGNEVTPGFIGGYTDDLSLDSDICYIANSDINQEIEFGCADFSTDLLANGFEQTIPYSGSRNLRANVVNDLYGPAYDLAGTSSDDVLTNFGLYMGSGVLESFSEATYSIPYQNAICSMADITADGFADIMCATKTSITFYTSQQINQNVDLLQIIPDVGGATMCPGNQSFISPAPPTGYVDAEEDQVRLVADCTNDGSFDSEGELVDYGDTPVVYCYYNQTATNNAKICLQDSANLGDYTECLYYVTQVNAVPGCEDPDQSYDQSDAQADDGEGPSVPGQISGDLESDAETILTWMGGTTQNSKDLILVGLIAFVMIMIAVQVRNHGYIISIVVGGLALTIVTITGWVRPVYLVVLIILALVALIILRPLMARDG